MELFEHEKTERLGREEAAARLRALADELSQKNGLTFVREGVRHTVRVPDQVELTVEIEIGEENEIEIEISW